MKRFSYLRSVPTLAMACALAACAQLPKPLYHWEGYQRQVYEYLKGDGTTPVEQMTVLQAQHDKARASGSSLPPGFRAHLGLLHLQAGRFEEARQMLEAEKAAFPESAQYMDFLLKRFSERSREDSIRNEHTRNEVPPSPEACVVRGSRRIGQRMCNASHADRLHRFQGGPSRFAPCPPADQ